MAEGTTNFSKGFFLKKRKSHDPGMILA